MFLYNIIRDMPAFDIKNTVLFCFLEAAFLLMIFFVFYCFSGFFFSVHGIIFTLLFMPAVAFQFGVLVFLIFMFFRIAGRRVSFYCGTSVTALINIAAVIDIFVYGQYHFHVNPAMIQLLLGPARSEIFNFPVSMYILAAPVITAVAICTFFVAFHVNRIKISSVHVTAAVCVFSLIFCAYNIHYAYARYVFIPDVLAQISILPLAYPLSMNSRLKKMGFRPHSGDFEEPAVENFSYPLQPLEFDGTTGSNIVIIVVDALRFDMMKSDIMPHTAAAAARHGFFNFSRHFSGGNSTAAGIFSLFYSLPFSYWNSVSGVPPVLMKTVSDRHYETGIFASARLDSPDFAGNIFSGIKNLRTGSAGTNTIERDQNALDDFFVFLDEFKKRDGNSKTDDSKKHFMSFVFFDGPHAYAVPEKYHRPFMPSPDSMNYMILNQGTDPLPWLNLYKNSVYYTDSLIGRIIERLERDGRFNDTIVIITGDHGQELNETKHNSWGHNSNFSDWQTRVPMLLYVPGLKGNVMDYHTAHYDIVPTLMKRAFGCTTDPYSYSMGRDMIDGYGDKGRPYTIISSYTMKAVREENRISEFSNYGKINHFDENANTSDEGASAQVLKNALKDFGRFYK